MMIEYTATIRLTPHSEFPLDMLRYDCCHPLSSGWAVDPAHLSDTTRGVYVRRITDTRSHGKNWEPFTIRRWQSFGVAVVAIKSRTWSPQNGWGAETDVPFKFIG